MKRADWLSIKLQKELQIFFVTKTREAFEDLRREYLEREHKLL